MTMYKLLALTAVLALAGCATTTGGPGGNEAAVEAREGQQPQAKAAPAPAPAPPAVFPAGPLSAIQSSEVSSQRVASGTAAGRVVRILNGFKIRPRYRPCARTSWYDAARLHAGILPFAQYLFPSSRLGGAHMPMELSLLAFI